MMTRNRTRAVLAELQAPPTNTPTPAQTPAKPAAPAVKREAEPQSVSKRFAKTSLEKIAMQMEVISLSSDSDRHVTTDSDAGIMESVMDLSSSEEDDVDGDGNYMLEDEDDDDDEEEEEEEDDDDDDDEDESVKSGNEGRNGEEKTRSSSPVDDLLAEEVTKLIKGGDMKKLKVDNCRSYLRSFGLRLTGTKPVLIDRIKQHIQLREGGSRNYNRSTFTINCTGDVCKGDVVMFNQKVYDKYDVASGSSAQLGTRTVAGRVVKESYGAQRQQHTFTVEVLWSSGFRPLAPMKQLLVKGRNLYKRKTFRQVWADEGERRRSLDEKHERGAAARHVRAKKQGRNIKGISSGPVTKCKVATNTLKQLANPYMNTLAPVESNKSNLRSGVPHQSMEKAGTEAHLLNSHSTLAPKENASANNRSGGLDSLQAAWCLPVVNIQTQYSAISNSRAVLDNPTRGNYTSGFTSPYRRQIKTGMCSSEPVLNSPNRGNYTSGGRGFTSPYRWQRKTGISSSRPVHSSPNKGNFNPVGGGNASPNRMKPAQSAILNSDPVLDNSNRGSLMSGGVHASPNRVELTHNNPNSSSRDSRGGFTSPYRHRQWFKPVGQPVSSNQNTQTNTIGTSFNSPQDRVSDSTHNEVMNVHCPPGSRGVSPLPKKSIPCPTELCSNLGSKHCSSKLCYYCCKKKGGNCTNPNHRFSNRV